jgi:hypothetical protein
VSLTIQAISEEMARRRIAQSPLLDHMLIVRDRYNADTVMPVADTDDDVPMQSLNPLLIADAIDHPALYAAQAPPNIEVPALQHGKTSGVRSSDYAARRRKALYYSWDESWWEMVLGRFYRHLAAYATSAIVVEPDEDRKLPIFRTRDPLSAYPEPKAAEDLTLPCNVGFIKGMSLEWLHRRYPETKERFRAGAGYAVATNDSGELWDVVEWMDDMEIVVGVLGPRDSYNAWYMEPARWAYELGRFRNDLGICPAVIPRKVTLDRIFSQLVNLVGHADWMAKLLYLDIRATERSVFPDRYVVAKTGQQPRLAAGEWIGGETGDVNLILDADAVGELRGAPDPNNKMTIDRLERNFRVSSGLIPQAGGETYGALRTGRGIDALMGAALDPRTTELHRLAERYFSAINERLLLCYKRSYGARTFYVSSPLDPAVAEFTPNVHVEQDADGREFVRNLTSYPIPGMDDINSTQVIGQMMGAGLISQHDARRMHPHVRDPEGTEQRLLVEDLIGIAKMSLGTRASTPPGIPPGDIGRLIGLVLEGKQLHQAMEIVDREASERQATQAAPNSPEAMPGLANPGEGAEMGAGLAPQVQGPGGDLTRLRELVGALRAPAGGQA